MTIERKSDQWISVTQSVVLHGLVIGALAYGFYAYKKLPKPVQPTLAVEATVVESQGSSAPQPTPPAPEPEPAPEPPPEDVGPPAPSPEDVQQREQAQREEQERQEQQRREEEQRVALERQQAEEKAAAEQKAREEEAGQKRQQEQREAEEKRIAEAKRKAEEQRKAEEARRKAEEDRRQAQRQAELRKSLEAEERAMALRSSGALANWLGQIANRVQRAWIRPPNSRPGVECWVYVTQTPGGEVTNVRIGECNGDAALRESIESAVYRASPLPPAPDPALFDRNLNFLFKPTD